MRNIGQYRWEKWVLRHFVNATSQNRNICVFRYYAKQTAINVASINVYDHKRPEITTIENGLWKKERKKKGHSLFVSFTPFFSDLYYVWKLHSKRKRVQKNSMKFQFVFPGTVFKKRLKCTLPLSWKYCARGHHGKLSLSCETKYHHKIYTFPRKWS